MKVIKLAYTRGVTLNLDNFEFLRVDLCAEATIDEDEDFDAALKALRAKVKKALNADLALAVRHRDEIDKPVHGNGERRQPERP